MSTIVALIGPIEYWWDTPEDPNRFMSKQAVEYRNWRAGLNDWLVKTGYLVFRPHEAFKGPWDERAQIFNDAMVQIADIVICMRPRGIPGAGTDHELELAHKLNKMVLYAAPGYYLEQLETDLDIAKKCL